MGEETYGSSVTSVVAADATRVNFTGEGSPGKKHHWWRPRST